MAGHDDCDCAETLARALGTGVREDETGLAARALGATCFWCGGRPSRRSPAAASSDDGRGPGSLRADTAVTGVGPP